MFGMSVFQSVLQRLAEEDLEETEAAPPDAATARSGLVMGLNAGFVAELRRHGAIDSVSRAYSDTAGEAMLQPPQPVQPPVMPDHLRRIRPEEIAQDLGVADPDTRVSLIEKRRRFASLNHPDTHLPQFRANATTRMKIANMIVDEALSRLSKSRKA